ncbi:hypothetical protein PS385_09115 [Limosilactobacillus fermentum]|uniref:hypothetical protein n=1 Tax=Limosilactobacillus fermentum TaxID=1613 RepID=UPI002F26B066
MAKTKRSVSYKQATVRLSREQSDEIDKASRQLGISTAEVIRLALDDNLRQRKVVEIPSKLKAELLPQIMSLTASIASLRKMYQATGNNINQIARAANRNQFYQDQQVQANLQAAETSARAATDAVDKLAKEVTKLWEQLV